MSVKNFVNNESPAVEQKFPVGVARHIKVLSVEESRIFEGKMTVRYEEEGVLKWSPSLKNLVAGCQKVLDAGRQYVTVTMTEEGSQFKPAKFSFKGLTEEAYKETCKLEDDFEFSL